ncbi:acyl-CoA dehydrogenase family protein [Nocardia sp. NPDC059691]|uniref:acyl-CoA dehydrogenase family protein n=1 Tax=Nocardia sp. NPDC059691 TaxID=3346908 RepID=UPI0036BBCFE2
MLSPFFTPDHDAYRASVRKFLKREVAPYYDTWEEQRLIDKAVWTAAGQSGIVGLSVPEEYGGAGETDWRYRMVVAEETAAIAATSFNMSLAVQDDLVLPYLLDLASAEQKRRWLPGCGTGELVGAIAMTEPNAGSDLQAIRTNAERNGDSWVLNGQKTFISNGILADLVIVLAKTREGAGAGSFSLFVVEQGMPGFERGRKLDKLGLLGQDTAELFFENVRLTESNLLGEEGQGFFYLMQHLPKERTSIAVGGMVACEAALSWTLDYVFQRKAFGRRIGDFQNTRFQLAEMETEIDVTRAYIERCILRLNDGTLTMVEASKAKWWVTELQQRVTTRCLQLFGGYGFMNEFPIARAYRDARVQTLYGGTTEIMKEIIGRDITSRFR